MRDERGRGDLITVDQGDEDKLPDDEKDVSTIYQNQMTAIDSEIIEVACWKFILTFEL